MQRPETYPKQLDIRKFFKIIITVFSFMVYLLVIWYVLVYKNFEDANVIIGFFTGLLSLPFWIIILPTISKNKTIRHEDKQNFKL
ncbi:MAG TPA: hypothetical protein GX707_17525 [Epulopiscium sp.]|nr:hypothetical protein [Candidatus Epulonipiscium sp.]